MPNHCGYFREEKIAEVLSKAVDIYGVEAQIWMAIEEMAELNNALAKYKRGRVVKKDVCEEIADVTIMMIQLAAIFGSDDVNDYLEQKVDRLDKRLAKHRNNENKGSI